MTKLTLQQLRFSLAMHATRNSIIIMYFIVQHCTLLYMIDTLFMHAMMVYVYEGMHDGSYVMYYVRCTN